METMLPGHLRFTGFATLSKGIGWGSFGGLVATLVMDITLLGALSAVGEQPLYCFSTVGDTVMLFLAILGIKITGGIPLGIATHYIVGPLVGAFFGATITQLDDLQVITKKKMVVFAILYVEILSQPMLALTPLLLKTSASETLFWYAGSFVMHFICGVVLGLVVNYGLRLAKPTSPIHF